jgi:SAM-dependent methyltransferase
MNFDAKLYSALHQGYPGDVQFYVSVCQDAKRVLELGCGNGRITMAIAGIAREVVGVDRHSDMLDLAKKRLKESRTPTPNVALTLCDMTHIEHLGTFDRIIIPFTTIYCLDRDALSQCLAQIARMLSPDGLLAFDAYPAEIFHESSLSVSDWDPIGEIQVDDTTYLVEEETTVYRKEKQIRVAYRHTPISASDSTTLEYAILHHYVLLSEWPDLLKNAGLNTFECYGGFDGRPFHEDADRIVMMSGLKKS